MKRKIRLGSLVLLYIILFSVLPGYFQIGGVRAINILVLLFVGMYVFLKRGHLPPVHLGAGLSIVVLIWVIARVFIYFVHSEIDLAVLFLLFFLFAGYIIVGWINSKERFFKAIDVIIRTAGVVCFFGIIESFTHFNIFSLLNNSGAILNYNAERLGLLRIISFTYHAISYSLYLALVGCLTIYRISNLRSKVQKRNFTIIYILIVINILLTLSRSIIIVFIAAQLILMYKFGMTRMLKRIGLFVLALAILATVYSAITGTENLALQVIYMILAVFDGRYADMLSSSWGVEDKSGVGNRLQLYGWVWISVRNNLLYGFGENTLFRYTFDVSNGIYTWQNTKRSIEVNHLWLLYHYGLIGMIPETFMYIFVMIKGLIQSVRRHASWEGRINFNFLFFTIILMDLISWFAVNSSSEWTTMYLIWFLWAAYNGNKLYEKE